MHEQLRFDAAASRAARDRAIEQVERGAPEDWKEAAYLAGIELCRRQTFWTTDDLWALLGQVPPEARALGPIVKRLQRDGYCRPTPHFRSSQRVAAHAGPKRVWRSFSALAR